MSFEKQQLKKIIEAALMASGQSMSIDQIMVLFLDDQQPDRDEVKEVLMEIAADCENRGIELKQVSSGYRFQAKQEYAPWISRLWEEKPPRYSRALLETLVLIAYRQPITRGEIEDVRGVTVSTQIIKTLLERDWVKVVGHRDVPGKPALYATTKDFLDYFNLKSLEELPTLAEIRDLDQINAELAFNDPEFEQQEQDLDKMMGDDEGLDIDAETDAEVSDAGEADNPEAIAADSSIVENNEVGDGEHTDPDPQQNMNNDTVDTVHAHEIESDEVVNEDLDDISDEDDAEEPFDQQHVNRFGNQNDRDIPESIEQESLSQESQTVEDIEQDSERLASVEN